MGSENMEGFTMITKEIIQRIIDDGAYTNSRGSTYKATVISFNDSTGVFCYSIWKDGEHIMNVQKCDTVFWYNTPDNKSWRYKC